MLITIYTRPPILLRRTVKKSCFTPVFFPKEPFLPINSANWFTRLPVSALLDGTLQAITDELHSWLADGWIVEVGELGFFSLSLKCDKAVANKKDIRSPSVHFQNVNLRIGSKFRNRFQTMELERKASPYISHSKLTLEERRKKLLQHLNKYGCITRTDYEQLTGKAKHQAVADLNLFLEEGIIRKYGSGKTVVYLKP